MGARVMQPLTPLRFGDDTAGAVWPYVSSPTASLTTNGGPLLCRMLLPDGHGVWFCQRPGLVIAPTIF